MSAVLALQQLGETTATDSEGQRSFEASLRYRIAALSDFVPPIIARRKIDAYDWAQAVARDFGGTLAPNSPQLHFLPNGELAVVSLLGNVAFRWQPETDTVQAVRISGTPLPDSELASKVAPAGSAAAVCFTRDCAARGTAWRRRTARAVVVRTGAAGLRLGVGIAGAATAVGLLDLARRTVAAGRAGRHGDIGQCRGLGRTDWQTRPQPRRSQIDGSMPPFYLSVRFGSDHRRAIVVGSKAAVLDLETGTVLVPQTDGVSPWASLTNQGRTFAAATRQLPAIARPAASGRCVHHRRNPFAGSGRSVGAETVTRQAAGLWRAPAREICTSWTWLRKPCACSHPAP